eukprot:TRINITY_DN25261_c0_g1_i3.p2 TRINITY_DN25261_c0_g1~~TRINITY_DN25261_c0_g1_i3.p2  ORF type:complete len:109 (+),score=24.06 TRINITY_DN25261_c0_g1_i3:102-428(+)
MIRRPPRSTQGVSSAASDVYKRQVHGSINIENVILTDANGNPIGMERIEGAVENPIMNPLAASMYTPYIASYNQMILNPQSYYSARPQANQSSSAIGFPKMPESNTPQ